MPMPPPDLNYLIAENISYLKWVIAGVLASVPIWIFKGYILSVLTWVKMRFTEHRCTNPGDEVFIDGHWWKIREVTKLYIVFEREMKKEEITNGKTKMYHLKSITDYWNSPKTWK